MTVNFAPSEPLHGSPPISEARQGRRRRRCNALSVAKAKSRSSFRGFALARPPVLGFFLSFKCRTRATRGWPCFSCPIDGFVLGLEGGEDAAADANGIGLGAR
jgi:hypothetical protein